MHFYFGLFVDLISLKTGRNILTTPQGVESLTSFYVENLSARPKKRHTHLVGSIIALRIYKVWTRLKSSVVIKQPLKQCIRTFKTKKIYVLHQTFLL